MAFRPNSILMNRNLTVVSSQWCHSTQWIDYNTSKKPKSNLTPRPLRFLSLNLWRWTNVSCRSNFTSKFCHSNFTAQILSLKNHCKNVQPICFVATNLPLKFCPSNLTSHVAICNFFMFLPHLELYLVSILHWSFVSVAIYYYVLKQKIWPQLSSPSRKKHMPLPRFEPGTIQSKWFLNWHSRPLDYDARFANFNIFFFCRKQFWIRVYRILERGSF